MEGIFKIWNLAVQWFEARFSKVAKEATLESGIDEIKEAFQEVADKAIPLESISSDDINSLFPNNE